MALLRIYTKKYIYLIFMLQISKKAEMNKLVIFCALVGFCIAGEYSTHTDGYGVGGHSGYGNVGHGYGQVGGGVLGGGGGGLIGGGPVGGVGGPGGVGGVIGGGTGGIFPAAGS